MTEVETAADKHEQTITYAMRMNLPRFVVRTAFEAGAAWQAERIIAIVRATDLREEFKGEFAEWIAGKMQAKQSNGASDE